MLVIELTDGVFETPGSVSNTIQIQTKQSKIPTGLISLG